MALPSYTPLSADIPVTNMASQTAVTSNSAEVNNNPNDSASLKNEFLTLMVAQIQNQDPLDPMDGTEYVSQLAQFAQVESTENMVMLMQNNMVLMDNLQVLTTAGLVGQDVLIRGNEFSIDGHDEQSVAGQVNLTAPSSQVNLIIEDKAGQKHTVSLGPKEAGAVDFELDLEELGLSKGDYSISVELSHGQEYTPQILMAGKVESVDLPTNGGASLVTIRGLGSVPFYDISQFGAQS